MATSLYRVGSATTYFEFTDDGKVTFTDGTGTTTMDPAGNTTFTDGTGTVTVDPDGTLQVADGSGAFTAIDPNGSMVLSDGTNVMTLDPTLGISSDANVGTKNGATVTEVNYSTGDGRVKTVLTLASTPIVLTDDTGVAAYGGVKLYDFPDGVIIWDGGHITCSLALSAAGVNADFDSDISMGTATATTGATLTTTEENLVPSTTVPQAVSSAVAAAPAFSFSANTGLVFDGSATAKDLYLNMKVDDVDHDVASTPTNILVTGTVTFCWRLLNDH